MVKVSDIDPTSALGPFADSSRTSPEVREVPIPDSCSAAHLHSLTSSASASSVGGTRRKPAVTSRDDVTIQKL